MSVQDATIKSHLEQALLVSEDYVSAATRHLADAELLSSGQRPDNAAYLGGYVIECVLKRVLEVHGYAGRSFGHDARNMTTSALFLATVLSPGLARYRIDRIPGLEAAVALWSPALRYSSTGSVLTGGANTVLAAARELYKTVLIPLLLDDSTERLR